MRLQQRYSEAFRRKVASEVLSSKESITEVSRRYGVTHELASVWTRRYEEGQVTDEDYRALKVRIAELEKVVDRLARENAFLKKISTPPRPVKSVDSSIVTVKSLAASKRAARSWGLREAATTTTAQDPKDERQTMSGLKDDLKPLPPPIRDTDIDK